MAVPFKDDYLGFLGGYLAGYSGTRDSSGRTRGTEGGFRCACGRLMSSLHRGHRRSAIGPSGGGVATSAGMFSTARHGCIGRDEDVVGYGRLRLLYAHKRLETYSRVTVSGRAWSVSERMDIAYWPLCDFAARDIYVIIIIIQSAHSQRERMAKSESYKINRSVLVTSTGCSFRCSGFVDNSGNET